MAKFAKWKGFVDQSRDLARGLYALTFKDNMPGEPVSKEWLSVARSPDGSSFTILPLSPLGFDPIANNYYTMIGTRCFYRMEATLIISGSSTIGFWLRLPAPAKSVGNFRNWGKYFDLTTVEAPMFVDVLVGYPSEWWMRLYAHTVTAALGTWPIGTGQLSIEGNYEVHPAWIKTGYFSDPNITFNL